MWLHIFYRIRNLFYIYFEKLVQFKVKFLFCLGASYQNLSVQFGYSKVSMVLVMVFTVYTTTPRYGRVNFIRMLDFSIVLNFVFLYVKIFKKFGLLDKFGCWPPCVILANLSLRIYISVNLFHVRISFYCLYFSTFYLKIEM